MLNLSGFLHTFQTTITHPALFKIKKISHLQKFYPIKALMSTRRDYLMARIDMGKRMDRQDTMLARASQSQVSCFGQRTHTITLECMHKLKDSVNLVERCLSMQLFSTINCRTHHNSNTLNCLDFH